MPMLLMMSLRGGKETTGSEDTVWEVGVLVSNAAVFSEFWPLLAGRFEIRLLASCLAQLWMSLIGHNPLRTTSNDVRRLTTTAYFCMGIWYLYGWTPNRYRHPSIWPGMHEQLNMVLSSLIFAGSVVWGLVKLIEDAWAIGGLGGGDRNMRERRGR
ncbi:hypothetical protein TREMEDRAFT_55941 [Tremella mesenterica DSM 1558]|uniref:uncharacterized protein n=1 Tax=Tremella mesenterica (strain ATCC 24925 / CBS 8224 / DSM 1558 / NBRC 9311 / NRRL Y-6157 / RJB 2259-6 / UBC 559-6) TaxID=578456 RepID=UPI0003F4A11F|nr:uncharacterized protein TREMEDRAFT_55941 [Tremella mesenterica DSM 1558]EIW72475.1 hypothetical protein TREMEDRAFT_55941 [Tremella mesenterica DSM 1558]